MTYQTDIHYKNTGGLDEDADVLMYDNSFVPTLNFNLTTTTSSMYNNLQEEEEQQQQQQETMMIMDAPMMNKEINESNFNRLFNMGEGLIQDQGLQNLGQDQEHMNNTNFLNDFLGLQNNLEESVESNSVRSSSEFFDTFSTNLTTQQDVIALSNTSTGLNAPPFQEEEEEESHRVVDNSCNKDPKQQQQQQQKTGRFGFRYNNNPLSNMFRSQSQKLRGMYPSSSSSSSSGNVGAINVPPQFIDPMVTTNTSSSVEQEGLFLDSDSIDPLQTNNMPTMVNESSSILKRGKRSATNSIVNALSSARFSFNKQRNDKQPSQSSNSPSRFLVKEEHDQEDINSIMDKMLNFDSLKDNEMEELYSSSLIENGYYDSAARGSLDMVLPPNIKIQVENIDSNSLRSGMDFDQELDRVTSLASLTPSNYDFVSTNAANNKTTNPTTVSSSSSSASSQVKIQMDTDEPNYAALFSNMNPKKRPSRSFSISRLSLSQANKKHSDSNVDIAIIPATQSLKEKETGWNFLKIEEADEVESLRTPRSSFQSSNNNDQTSLTTTPSTSKSHTTTTTEPKVRGRKPSTEYDATRTFVCKSCQRRFKREEHLKRHFRSLHMHEKPFNCPKCMKKFSRTDNLTQHIKTHSLHEEDVDI